MLQVRLVIMDFFSDLKSRGPACVKRVMKFLNSRSWNGSSRYPPHMREYRIEINGIFCYYYLSFPPPLLNFPLFKLFCNKKDLTVKNNLKIQRCLEIQSWNAYICLYYLYMSFPSLLMSPIEEAGVIDGMFTWMVWDCRRFHLLLVIGPEPLAASTGWARQAECPAWINQECICIALCSGYGRQDKGLPELAAILCYPEGRQQVGLLGGKKVIGETRRDGDVKNCRKKGRKKRMKEKYMSWDPETQ